MTPSSPHSNAGGNASAPAEPRQRVALVGARGYVGAELLKLLAGHPTLALGYAGSRALVGQRISDVVPELAASPQIDAAMTFASAEPQAMLDADCAAVVLALPNEQSQPYVSALLEQRPDTVIIDLSADYRFDKNWHYGLAERNRAQLKGARRIANPGCYATAAQLALWPLLPDLADNPRIFGVSGYSGAGTTPSRRNDPEQLRDNLMPYALTGHMHEREISAQLGRPVNFMPHVAPFFRGISLTIDVALTQAHSADQLLARLQAHYQDEPLITLSEDAPLVRAAVGRHGVQIGGIQCDGRRAVLVATVDNLLKGAASQCVQNLNLALGYKELAGICT